ncbi:acyl-CoA dehydrogenase family protein [uncultured Phenylobacterium sp.]|uniref:acyl-CoA dehydrogenase family protein n=1 Tax=uncultured Phenylobacterium sp. TaxID=349273 RepID=UPI0025D4B2C5|nr:acyl-CoA dehydrogenase family protein [uncultured Phenylobacterium sp.]
MASHDPLLTAPLLDLIAAQAAQADATRSVAPEVIAALKGNDVMRMSASREIGGLEASVSAMGHELEAVAAACGSTAWCLWNHLCVFHFYCGLLGPAHIDVLKAVTAQRQWVCLPGGAGTAVKGRPDGDDVILEGVAAFGSGLRYADHVGVPFLMSGDKAPSFALLRTNQPGVQIDPTWMALSLRASSTDHVHYEGARIAAARVVPFPVRSRETFRDPDFAVVNRRYREDWVALSDLWLGCMAVGVANAALDDACRGIQGRVAIMGTKMVERPTIHVNIGQAGALVRAARAAVYGECARMDARIADGRIPTESDYLDALAATMMAIRFCDDAMRLILRVLGGNGLREGQAFERRYRDFQAMPLHINAHPDRVSEQLGRHLLGLPTENAF